MYTLKEIWRFLKISHFKFECAVNNLSQGEIKAKIFFSCFTVVFAGRFALASALRSRTIGRTASILLTILKTD